MPREYGRKGRESLAREMFKDPFLRAYALLFGPSVIYAIGSTILTGKYETNVALAITAPCALLMSLI